MRRNANVSSYAVILLAAVAVGFSALQPVIPDLLAQDTVKTGYRYWVDSAELPQLEEEYLREIRPQPVDRNAASVIKTGKLILYGQFVEPPYELKLEGGALFINGVKACPTIRSPWRYLSRPLMITEDDRQVQALTERIRAAHAEILSSGGEDWESHLLSYIRQQEPSVEHAEWIGEGGIDDILMITTTYGRYFGMDFHTDMEETGPREVQTGIAKSQYQHVQGTLTKDALVMIGYQVTTLCPPVKADTMIAAIHRALSSKSFEDLRKATHDEELAREILFVHERIAKGGE